MSLLNAARAAPEADAWTARLPVTPRHADAYDRRMVVSPPGADPGYRMPNPAESSLNQDNTWATGFLNTAASAPAAGPPDMSERYNTTLSPEQEAAFQAWGKAQAARDGRNPAADTFDYDMRGFWVAGDGNPKFADDGHAGDTFKKPNHPTFSDQSRYHGIDGHEGGTWGGGNGQPWTFTPSTTNLKMRDLDDLQRYFDEREKGNRLIRPTADLRS